MLDGSATDIAEAIKSSGSKSAVDKTIGDRFERILGGLLFSQNDILEVGGRTWCCIFCFPMLDSIQFWPFLLRFAHFFVFNSESSAIL
jgi:hypothetical protein